METQAQENKTVSTEKPKSVKADEGQQENKTVSAEKPKSVKADEGQQENKTVSAEKPKSVKADEGQKKNTQALAPKPASQAAPSSAKGGTQAKAISEVPDRPKKEFHRREPSEFPRRRFGNDETRSFSGNNSRFRPHRRVLDTRKITIDYKKSVILERFISKTGKILPQRVTGASAIVQRRIAREIKRARHIGLLPYSDR